MTASTLQFDDENEINKIQQCNDYNVINYSVIIYCLLFEYH